MKKIAMILVIAMLISVFCAFPASALNQNDSVTVESFVESLGVNVKNSNHQFYLTLNEGSETVKNAKDGSEETVDASGYSLLVRKFYGNGMVSDNYLSFFNTEEDTKSGEDKVVSTFPLSGKIIADGIEYIDSAVESAASGESGGTRSGTFGSKIFNLAQAPIYNIPETTFIRVSDEQYVFAVVRGASYYYWDVSDDYSFMLYQPWSSTFMVKKTATTSLNVDEYYYSTRMVGWEFVFVNGEPEQVENSNIQFLVEYGEDSSPALNYTYRESDWDAYCDPYYNNHNRSLEDSAIAATSGMSGANLLYTLPYTLVFSNGVTFTYTTYHVTA